MQTVLNWYLNNKDWVHLFKDLVFFIGASQVISFIWRRNFVTKTQEIAKNLEVREAIDDHLQEHVRTQTKNGIKDIGIRLVHWKNYPRCLENDAFKHFLRVEQDDSHTMPSGWINNTGINVQEHLWFTKSSIYVDDNGIFFFPQKVKHTKAFKS